MTFSVASCRQVALLRSTVATTHVGPKRRGTSTIWQLPTRTLASSSPAATTSTITFNINNALKKADESHSFQELASLPVMTLQGIGPKHGQELESLGLKTIQQLADYKFFHLAKSVTVLAKIEEANGRSDDAVMNLFKGVDKEFQHLPLVELIRQPIHALKGISPEGGELFQSLGVKTVEDLAAFKYCQWAEAIVVAARFEKIDE